MYQIFFDNQHETATCTLLDKERGVQSTVAPARGALLIGLKKGETEYLYFDPENFASEERPRCGMPVLFPCCGRNTNETVCLEGKPYPMPIHGFAHTSAWTVTASGADQTGAWLVLELTPNEESEQMYPYRFRLQLEFRVSEGTLTVLHRCTNEDARPMPFDFGYHPYFLMSALHCAEFEVPGRTQLLKLPEGKPESGHFIAAAPSGTVYRDTARGTELTLTHSNNFDGLVFWSVPAKGFVCVEPWQGKPDGLNNGTSLVLQPGQTACGRIGLTPGRIRD